MAWYTIVALIVFVILCIVTSLLVLLTSNKGASMGIFGAGASQTPFGSRSSDVLTKITSILVTVFFIYSLGLAILISTPRTMTVAPEGGGEIPATDTVEGGAVPDGM